MTVMLRGVESETGHGTYEALRQIRDALRKVEDAVSTLTKNNERLTGLDSLSDVDLEAENLLTADEILSYDSALGLWVNQTIAELGLALSASVAPFPVVDTVAVGSWAAGSFYGQIRIFSNGASPALHTFYIWSSGTGGDEWLWLAERA